MPRTHRSEETGGRAVFRDLLDAVTKPKVIAGAAACLVVYGVVDAHTGSDTNPDSLQSTDEMQYGKERVSGGIPKGIVIHTSPGVNRDLGSANNCATVADSTTIDATDVTIATPASAPNGDFIGFTPATLEINLPETDLSKCHSAAGGLLWIARGAAPGLAIEP
jgi:hypothetical protein